MKTEIVGVKTDWQPPFGIADLNAWCAEILRFFAVF